VTQLKLVEAIEGARPLPGTIQLLHLRTFWARRSAREHGITFLPIAEALNPAATPETLSSGIFFADVPGDSLDAYALVVNVAGEFHTIDQMIVMQASIATTETVAWLALTKVESADGLPALVDVFLILPLTPEIVRSGSVRLSFSVSRRSCEGEVTALPNEIPDCVVPLV
jgi:hypothetical protein